MKVNARARVPFIFFSAYFHLNSHYESQHTAHSTHIIEYFINFHFIADVDHEPPAILCRRGRREHFLMIQ